MKSQVGMIIGIIAEEIKADPWAALQQVADIGYEGIEGSAPLLVGDAAANLRRLHDMGLRLVSHSISMDEMADSAKLDKAIADAHSLQAEHLSCWWSPCDSAERVAADAETLNRAGEKVSAAGLKLCYHNHDQELRNVFDGKRALDLLVEKTQPGKVFFEIDVAWVTFGGGNPVDVIHALGDRVPAIHMKDLASMDERGQFTSVGTGLVDVVASAQAAWDVSAGWIIYEQDRPHRLTGMESAQASFLNMKELGIA